jgi:hypothetical protein
MVILRRHDLFSLNVRNSLESPAELATGQDLYVRMTAFGYGEAANE